MVDVASLVVNAIIGIGAEKYLYLSLEERYSNSSDSAEHVTMQDFTDADLSGSVNFS